MNRWEQQELTTAAASELDGIVDRYVNRRISVLLTRGFLWVGASPNTITLLSLLIGLLAAIVFSMGSYEASLLGCLLFQVSIIVDCCDGEVARLTHRESAFGRQFDLIADNVVHLAIFAGIAWALYVERRALEPLLLASGALVGGAVAVVMVTRAISMSGRRVRTSMADSARLDFLLNNLANRDFSVVLLLFALLHHLDWFLWLAAIGSNLFWLTLAWTTRLPRPEQAVLGEARTVTHHG